MKFINYVAKVSKKIREDYRFGGIFFVLDKFDSILSSLCPVSSSLLL